MTSVKTNNWKLEFFGNPGKDRGCCSVKPSTPTSPPPPRRLEVVALPSEEVPALRHPTPFPLHFAHTPLQSTPPFHHIGSPTPPRVPPLMGQRPAPPIPLSPLPPPPLQLPVAPQVPPPTRSAPELDERVAVEGRVGQAAGDGGVVIWEGSLANKGCTVCDVELISFGSLVKPARL